MNLTVDTDRDGRLDPVQDDVGEASLDRDRGALFMVNLDDDDGDGRPDAASIDPRTGELDPTDRRVNGPDDALDLAPVDVSLGARDQDRITEAWLSLPEPLDARAVHIYASNAPGSEAIIGGPLETRDRVDLLPYVKDNGELRLHVEGLAFRWTTQHAYGGLFPDGYDGTLRLRASVSFEDGETGTDEVVLQVSPLILTPSTQPTVASFEAVGGRLIEGSQSLGTGDGRWVQDHAFFAATQAPGLRLTQVTVRLPMGARGVASWPVDHLLGPDAGVFTLGPELAPATGNLGGNVMVLPPAPGWPLGRIVVGDTMNPALHAFLSDQRIQAPLPLETVDVGWLNVGHVDELLAVVPDGELWRVAVPDPRGTLELLHRAREDGLPPDSVFFADGPSSAGWGLTAAGGGPNRLEHGGIDPGHPVVAGASYLRIYAGAGAGQVARISAVNETALLVDRVWQAPLEMITNGAGDTANATWFQVPDASSRYVLVEGSRMRGVETPWPSPAVLTLHELIEHDGFAAFNREVATHIEASVARLRAAYPAVGEPIPVPALFHLRAEASAQGTGAAPWLPPTVNLQVTEAGTWVPAPMGPATPDGQDVLAEATVEALGSSVRFVDAWEERVLRGGVHCATLVLREPPSLTR